MRKFSKAMVGLLVIFASLMSLCACSFSAKLFKTGVWAASVDGKVDTYFLFQNSKEGKIKPADGSGGEGFTCKQSGKNIVFYFGSAKDEVKAEFSKDGKTGTFKYTGKTVVYTFEPVKDADVNNFVLPENEEASKETTTEQTTKKPDSMFTKGVWKASIDGKADTYFLFYNEEEGKTIRADGSGGIGFTCEQSGLNIVFHFGSPDDETKAEFSATENIGKFYYKDKPVKYSFEHLADEDVDTFQVPGSVNTETTAAA